MAKEVKNTGGFELCPLGQPSLTLPTWLCKILLVAQVSTSRLYPFDTEFLFYFPWSNIVFSNFQEERIPLSWINEPFVFLKTLTHLEQDLGQISWLHLLVWKSSWLFFDFVIIPKSRKPLSLKKKIFIRWDHGLRTLEPQKKRFELHSAEKIMGCFPQTFSLAMV